MYFWTNTPDQVKFITLASEVNRLNAYINDPNVDESQAQIYQVQFIAAKAKMALQFLIVNSDWEEWLNANDLDTPQMARDGTIGLIGINPPLQKSTLLVFGQTAWNVGETLYWNDFYRMLSLRAFLLRSAPGKEVAVYHPENYFHE